MNKMSVTILDKTTGDSIRKTTPYFERKNIVIYNDDFLKITTIPKSSIDLIITSPPCFV